MRTPTTEYWLLFSNPDFFPSILSSNSLNSSPSSVESAAHCKRLLSTIWKTYSAAQRTEFEETLGQILDHVSSFKSCLLPLLPSSAPCPLAAHHIGSSVQESLIRFFLEMPHLQTRLIVLLLEKLPEYDYRDGELLEENVPKLILSQFRWLPWIENSVSVAEAFLSALSLTSSVALKRDIITWIPETADDAAVGVLVQPLLTMMETEPEMLGACLDTLSNLKLSDEHLVSIQSSATDLLDSVDPDNLPLLVKFLFHVVKTELLPKLFKDLRMKLKLETLPGNRAGTSSDAPGMLVECLKAGLRARQELVTAYVQEFSAFSPKDESGPSSKTPHHHTVLDIWLLVLVHANLPHLRPKIELVLRKKVLNEAVRAQLLTRAISLHPSALRDLYPAVMDLAQMLMQYAYQDTGSSLKLAAVMMYTTLFSVSDALTRQALLSQLMRHVSSSSNAEIQGSLLAFERLVTKHAHTMEPYATQLQALIDFMDGSRLENPHILHLYFIFARLAYPRGPLSFSSESESKPAQFLTMLIMKQLSNPETRYRQMATLGCVAIICTLGAPMPSSSSSSTRSDETLSPKDQENINASTARITEIINSAFEVHTPEALELFLDELSSTLTQRARERPLRKEVIEYLSYVLSQYISSRVGPRSEYVRIGTERGLLQEPVRDRMPTASPLPLEVPNTTVPTNIWCDVFHMWPKNDANYEEAIAAGICFNLDTDDSGYPSTGSPENLATFAAIIRLLFIVHETLGQFTEIFLVFYSCLNLFPRPLMPTNSTLHDFLNRQREKTLESMATQLIHAINITREFLNIATRNSQLSGPEIGIPMEHYIAARTSQLVQLEAYLEEVLHHVPDYPTPTGASSATLPLVYAADILRDTPSASVKAKDGAKKSGTGSKSKKPKFTPATSEMDMDDLGDENGEELPDDEEPDENGEDVESSSKICVPASSSKASARGSADASSSSHGVGSLTKSWGHTGSFDLKKYRRNVLIRVLPRLRSLLPHALNALHQIEDDHMENQMRWMLISDVSEKVLAMAPRKVALNPAKGQKSDPSWLRSFPQHLDCVFEMVPALCSLPRHLALLVISGDLASVGGQNVGQIVSLGGFGSLPLCMHLVNPCLKLLLYILKNIFSMPIFYTKYEKEGGTASFVAQAVAESVLSAFRPADASQELSCRSWTEFVQACFARLVKLADVLSNFEAAVALVEVLEELAASILEDAQAAAHLQEHTSLVAYRLLNRFWCDKPVDATAANSIFGENQKNMPLDGLEKLISCYLGASKLADDHVQPLVQAMAKLVEKMNNAKAVVREAAAAMDEEEGVPEYKTLTRGTLSTFFKVVLARTNRSLASLRCKGVSSSAGNVNGGNEDDGNRNEEEEGAEEGGGVKNLLSAITLALKVCAFCLKRAMPQEVDRVMLGVALRQGKQMVEAFQGKSDWICAQVETYPFEVQHVIKTYQHATRTLQQLCAMVKERQYKQLGALVAPLKRAIEMVISKMRLLSDKHGFGDLVDVKVSASSYSSATNAAIGASTASSSTSSSSNRTSATSSSRGPTKKQQTQNNDKNKNKNSSIDKNAVGGGGVESTDFLEEETPDTDRLHTHINQQEDNTSSSSSSSSSPSSSLSKKRKRPSQIQQDSTTEEADDLHSTNNEPPTKVGKHM